MRNTLKILEKNVLRGITDMKFRDALIVLLVLLSGYFAYKSYGYKTQYEIRKNWTSPDFCSDENLGAINFLINSNDNPFNKARDVVALKDNGCFYYYSTLVNSAQEVINWEKRTVQLLNKTDTISVEMLKDYEKDYKNVSRYFGGNPYMNFDENPHMITRFNEELDKRATKELEQLFGREKL